MATNEAAEHWRRFLDEAQARTRGLSVDEVIREVMLKPMPKRENGSSRLGWGIG